MLDVLDAVETPQQAARRLSAPALRDGFKPEALHTYTSASGEPLFWRIRLKHPETGAKWIRPMRRTADGTGYEIGEPPAPPAGKLLYNLHRIAADPAAVVIVSEGEKAADALGKLGSIATTSGGANSASAADWTPLKGRAVVIWPDADEPGVQYGRDVADKLQGIAAEVHILDVATIDLPPKGDAWDWCDAHPDATAADVLALATLPVLSAAPLATVATTATPTLLLLPVPQALERARALLLPQIDGTDAPYPLDALGPLADAARDLAEGAQVSPAMAGQSLLAAASLLAQGVANVRTCAHLQATPRR